MPPSRATGADAFLRDVGIAPVKRRPGQPLTLRLRTFPRGEDHGQVRARLVSRRAADRPRGDLFHRPL